MNDWALRISKWALDPKRFAEDFSATVNAFACLLLENGVELSRLNLLAVSRLPQLEMLVFRWNPPELGQIPFESTRLVIGTREQVYSQGSVSRIAIAHGHHDEAMFIQSPFYRAMRSGRILRRDLSRASEPLEFPIFRDLIREQVRDYLCVPITLPSPYEGAFSLSSKAERPFEQDFVEALPEIGRALAPLMAWQVERLSSRATLGAYVGHDPASRIMAGQVKVADYSSRTMLVGFADIHDFTAFSHSSSPEDVLHLLGRFYATAQYAISEEHGEILKFLGDGVLFTFDVSDGDRSVALERALRAVASWRESLHQEAAADDRLSMTSFSVGLHYGEVLYGNVGCSTRLDFTVVGDAVNVAARLQAHARDRGYGVVVSAEALGEFEEQSSFADIGHAELKGLPNPVELFVPIPGRVVRATASTGIPSSLESSSNEENAQDPLSRVSPHP